MVNESENFEFLYTECFTPVYRYLFFRVRNKDLAMDLTQDVFVKAFAGSVPVVRETALRYFYTIARNRLTDHFRKKKPVEIDSFEEMILQTEDLSQRSPEQIARVSDDLKLAYQLIAQLSELEQEIITMKYIQELTNTEISEMVGKTEENIRQILSRSMKKMKSYYES